MKWYGFCTVNILMDMNFMPREYLNGECFSTSVAPLYSTVAYFYGYSNDNTYLYKLHESS